MPEIESDTFNPGLYTVGVVQVIEQGFIFGYFRIRPVNVFFSVRADCIVRDIMPCCGVFGGILCREIAGGMDSNFGCVNRRKLCHDGAPEKIKVFID